MVRPGNIHISSDRLFRVGKRDCPAGLFAFTFVREPLAHFISAFTEIIWRIHYYGLSVDDVPDPVQVNRSHALLFLRGFLDLKPADRLFHRSANERVRHDPENLHHADLMKGAFGPGNRTFHFVGRLERAERDWAEAMRLADAGDLSRGFGRTQIDASSHHESSVDPQGAKAAMIELLCLEPVIRRGVCELLREDYECFSYDYEGCLGGKALA
eukprot:CAMPEP_0172643192 /NCGR_PEP_ID=MMETSP1068-20121228/235815_1 /TAXON_ID=35684 /ORGANISM="Pseudopedinella elastica, Strain CCMP716" /LENGTH=212 /DNA_ID=CAMNT_0013457191 /DNA_START=465 /DNA_END=1103 /DNA_ORIENTATION=-